MVLALLITICLAQGLGLYAGYRVYSRVRSRLNSFFVGNGQVSEFTELVDSTAQVFAARISSSMMATLRGHAGGTQKAITGALEQEAIDGSPVLNIVDAVAPNLTKRLGKNQLAMAGLQMILNRVMHGAQNAGGNGRPAGPGDQAKFNL